MNAGERTVLYLNDITHLHVPIISIVMGYAREIEPLHYVYHDYCSEGEDKYAFRIKEEAINYYLGVVVEHILYNECEYCDKKEIKRLVKLTDNFENLDDMPLQWICEYKKGINFCAIRYGPRVRPTHIPSDSACDYELEYELETSDSELETSDSEK